MKQASIFAAAVTGLMLGTVTLAHAEEKSKDKSAEGSKHACKGLNSCRGQGGCKTDKHACKGQNECKGRGGCKG